MPFSGLSASVRSSPRASGGSAAAFGLAAALCLLVAGMASAPAAAQDYPTRAITMEGSPEDYHAELDRQAKVFEADFRKLGLEPQ